MTVDQIVAHCRELTKRMAEDLAEYYSEVGVRCRYMHSEIETLERVKILRDLRKGEFDELIANCPNLVLIDLIKQFIQRTRRYEIALIRERRNILAATANHKAIMTGGHS